MLLLASQSPRRKEILTAAGFQFAVRPANVPEERMASETPEAYVQRLAAEKAAVVATSPEDFVVGADTVVVCDHHVLEKPRDSADASRMLELLSGREHQVMTGLCVRHGRESIVDRAVTQVRFSTLTQQEIEQYVTSGEPMDKAGAYAIQGIASRYIERIEGCYFNVVGLPISLLYRHLKALHYEPVKLP